LRRFPRIRIQLASFQQRIRVEWLQNMSNIDTTIYARTESLKVGESPVRGKQ